MGVPLFPPCKTASSDPTFSDLRQGSRESLSLQVIERRFQQTMQSWSIGRRRRAPSYKLLASFPTQVWSHHPSQDQDIPTKPSSLEEGKTTQNRDIQGVSLKADPASELRSSHALDSKGPQPVRPQLGCPGKERVSDSYWTAPKWNTQEGQDRHFKEPVSTTSEQNTVISKNSGKVFVVCAYE